MVKLRWALEYQLQQDAGLSFIEAGLRQLRTASERILERIESSTG